MLVTNNYIDRQRLVQDENRTALQAFKGDFDMKAQSIFDEMLHFKTLIDNMQGELQEKAKDHATGLQKVSTQSTAIQQSTVFHYLQNFTELVDNKSWR